MSSVASFKVLRDYVNKQLQSMDDDRFLKRHTTYSEDQVYEMASNTKKLVELVEDVSIISWLVSTITDVA